MYESKTVKRWKQRTRPTPVTDPASYWTADTDEDLATGPRAEAAEARFTEAVNVRRYPERRPVPHDPPPGWPDPLGDVAYHGLAGSIVQAVSPYTEASSEAILFDLLATFGIAVGPGPYMRLGGSQQQPRLNIIVVGDTARGRKGAARGIVHTLTEHADLIDIVEGVGYHSWTNSHYLPGLTSGEGLIAAIEANKDDGRMLVTESEFGRLIVAAGREGSTLSPIIRDAFDTNHLRVANKNSPIQTRNAYIGIVANITQDELVSLLGRKGSTEAINGFGNRFLYVASRRTHLIPMTALPACLIDEANTDLRDAVRAARRIEAMHLNDQALRLWSEWYYDRPEPGGLYGAMTARTDVLALRASMVYALLDGTKVINSKHLDAAIELIRYAEASALYLLGDATGNPYADAILRRLRVADPDAGTEYTTLTRADIFKLFSRNISATDLDAAVKVLTRAGYAEEVKIPTRGRPQQALKPVISEGGE